MKTIPLTFFLFASLAKAAPLVAIQPLGAVPESVVAAAVAGIRGFYRVEVAILPEMPLPRAAYHRPRNRYKAEDINDAIAASAPGKYDKVISITAVDISMTPEDGGDRGILGSAQPGGRACVVSTYRLRTGNPGKAVFAARLQKIANHELGHTFGVNHCPAAGCLMQDKRGKIATVDAESGRACAACQPRLPLVR